MNRPFFSSRLPGARGEENLLAAAPAPDTDNGLLRIDRSSLLAFRGLVILLAITIAGCDRGAGDLREWAPSDHDQPASPQGQVTARPGGEGPDPTLLDLAWRKNCATCHGSAGRGDGPQGPMVRAPDLTRPDWQQNVTDDEIATVIRNGKNKMPKFDLPDQVVKGLVQRIRSFRAQ